MMKSTDVRKRNNAAFSQQIFDISKAQGELVVYPDRVADNFGGEAMAMVV